MPKEPRNPTFQFYQLQILPRSASTPLLVPLQFAGEPTSTEILASKNDLAVQALKHGQKLKYFRGEFEYKVEFEQSPHILLLCVDRKMHVKRVTKQHDEETLESWPFLYVLIDARPNVQRIAIQVKTSVVQRTSTVANAIKEFLNKRLEKYQLKAFIEPVFSKNNFWAEIESHAGQVVSMRFELIRPNMPDISQDFGEDFKSFMAMTNSQTAIVKLESDPNGALNVDRNTPGVESFVSYSSQGGGDVVAVIRGGKKTRRITSGDQIVEVELDIGEIELRRGADVSEIFAMLLDATQQSFNRRDGDER